MAKPILLAILDGLALNPDPRGNAVFAANKPTLVRLFNSYPLTTLTSFGPRVGLPEGQMGNSEVGHLNIGGGRVVQQELTRIDAACTDGRLTELPPMKELGTRIREGQRLHIAGLTSTGGVHSSIAHLVALCTAAIKLGAKTIYVHAITDGRDRPPTDAENEISSLEVSLAELERANPGCSVKIVSVIGRYYAMDRDKRWERTKLAYDLFVRGTGEKSSSAVEFLRSQYKAEITDEFAKAAIIGGPDTTFRTGDAVLWFNFRTDRVKQILAALLPGFKEFEVDPNLKLDHYTLTEYSPTFPVKVLFTPTTVPNHFGEVVSNAGLRQLRIAETEKYPHVTYFFNGGVEAPLLNEERILVQSPKDVPTYDLKPQMSALEVTEKLLGKLSGSTADNPDVIVLNFANCDMVGHTGVYDAAVKAVETVDSCLGRIIDRLLELGGEAIVTADHGNSDQMFNYENLNPANPAPHTFHTMHPVPCVVVSKRFQSASLRPGGALCDIAPTLLQLLGLKTPAEMTGKSLLLP